MSIEWEKKVFMFDPNDIESVLGSEDPKYHLQTLLKENFKHIMGIFTALGAKIIYSERIRRKIYHLPSSEKARGYVRIREEPDENGTLSVTFTKKIFRNDDFPEEYEHVCDCDFETACRNQDYVAKAYHETFRVKYYVPGNEEIHELTIDLIPGLPPYIEIDCTTESCLDSVIKLIDRDHLVRSGSYDHTFAEYYGNDRDYYNNNVARLTFENIINEIKPTKNIEFLELMHEMYTSPNFGLEFMFL